MADDPDTTDTDFSSFQSPHEASVDRLVQSLDRAYHRPFLMMWRSFLQGLCNAFGMTVGYVIVFTVLYYLFQSFGGTSKLLVPELQKIVNNALPSELRSTPTPVPSALP